MARPLVFLDSEMTGLSVEEDRIFQLAMIVRTDGFLQERFRLINPERKVPEKILAMTRTTQEELDRQPPFAAFAQSIQAQLEGADIAGFNVLGYDIPLLIAEFSRTGIDWVPTGNVFDAKAIFHAKHPRDLGAAVEVYCGRSAVDSHNALVDAKDAMDVLLSQLKAHEDLAALAPGDLGAFCRGNDVDWARKLFRDEDGEVRFRFGKNKGQRVLDQRGYAEWMLGASFTKDTKFQVAAILGRPSRPKRNDEAERAREIDLNNQERAARS